MSRREREELEKQRAKAHYQKLHAAGKTEEAQADLARLAIVRKQREEAAKKREEEKKGISLFVIKVLLSYFVQDPILPNFLFVFRFSLLSFKFCNMNNFADRTTVEHNGKNWKNYAFTSEKDC